MRPPPEEAKAFKLSQKAEPEALLAPTLFPSNPKPVLLCTEGAGVEYNHPEMNMIRGQKREVLLPLAPKRIKPEPCEELGQKGSWMLLVIPRARPAWL